MISPSKLAFAVLPLWLLGSGCCTSLVPVSHDLHANPLLVIRSVQAGLLPTISTKRDSASWEIRVERVGTWQESRGWKGAAGVLPAAAIGESEMKALIALAHSLADLPEQVGHASTDVSYRQIEFTIGQSTHVVAAFPPAHDPGVLKFNDVWNKILQYFPERHVCR